MIPIHLSELSPPAFRSSFVGITYQIGNMISSPSAQIVNAIAEKTFVKAVDGESAEAYGPTMGIATAIIATGIIVTTAFGPERRAARFELTKPAGANEMDIRQKSIGADSEHMDIEKAQAAQQEHAVEKEMK